MEGIPEGDTRLKVLPPIRSKTNCNLLWDLLKMEKVDLIASHHSLVAPEYKFMDSGNFKKALNGIPGLGFALQTLWSKLRAPILSSQDSLMHYLVRMSKWLSLSPAKVLGISEDRGSIASGKIADFVVWNPEELVTGKSYCQYPSMCPYEGHDLHGSILQVYIRGQLAFDRGAFFPVGKMQIRPKIAD